MSLGPSRYLDRAAGWTTGQLRAALRRAVLAADPHAAGRRQREARRDAQVQAFDEPSGNAGLAGRELPPAEVLAADARLTALARWLRRAGAPGSLSQLRAAVYTALLTGRTLTSLLDQLTAPGSAAGADGADQDHPGQDAGADHDGADCDGPGQEHPDRGGLSPDIDGPDHDAAASEDTDGTTASADTADGSTARDDSAASAAGAAGAADTADVAAAADAAAAGWPAVSGTIHLTMPMPAFLGDSHDAGEVAGHGPVDAATSRDLATMLARSPKTRWCLTLTGPGGRAAAHACARRGPTPGQPVIGWAAGLRERLHYLEQGTCSHARQAPGYVPPNLLRHLIIVRQRRCSAPGCRRPAVCCDIDHSVPYDQGGRTCECNLAPACRAKGRTSLARAGQVLPGLEVIP